MHDVDAPDPNEPQIIRTPAGDELVVLTRAEYERLRAGGSDASEDEGDIALFDARMAEFTAEGTKTLPAGVSAAMLRGDSLLRALRKWRGLTQIDVAKKARLSQGAVSDFEAGRRRMTKDAAVKIAKALKVDLAWIKP